MSRPATSWSRRYTDSASTYCSRKRDVTIASRKDRVPRFSVYQLGLGSDPVMVVGRSVPAVAFRLRVSRSAEINHQTVQRRRPGTHVLFRTGNRYVGRVPPPILSRTRTRCGFAREIGAGAVAVWGGDRV